MAYAETAGSQDVVIFFANGKKQGMSLTNIPNKNQAKLYSFALKECSTILDVAKISVQAASTDGWNIETIVTTFADNKGRTYSGSIDRKVNRWIDHNDKPEYEKFDLKLSNHG